VAVAVAVGNYEKGLSPVTSVCSANAKNNLRYAMMSETSLQAVIRTAPPQAAQVSMPVSKSRFRPCAQVLAARRSAAVGSSVRCTHLVEESEVDLRLGHQGCQRGDSIEWREELDENLLDDLHEDGNRMRRLISPLEGLGR
jgi:hypothetical protein